MKLYDRLIIAKQREVKFPSSHVIVFDDPARGDGVAPQVLIPDPNWLAAAISGGYLPEVSAYHQTEYTVTLSDDTEYKRMRHHEFDDFIIELVGSDKYLQSQVVTKYTVHDAPIMDAMTELEAIEYLKQKDMPRRIWGNSSANFPRYQIVKHNSLPTSRLFRNQWNMTGDYDAPISIDIPKAKTEIKGKMINRYVVLEKDIENKRKFANWHEDISNEITDFDKIDMNAVLSEITTAVSTSQIEAAIPSQLN